MLPLLLAPLLQSLASNGLGILANAIQAKGKEFIEEKIGVKIPQDGIMSPELLSQLKEREMEHEETLLQLGIEQAKQSLEETKAYLEDTQNARNMQVEALKQADVFSKRFIYYFASAIFIVTAVYIFCVTFCTIPDNNLRMADTILGFLLGTLLGTVVNFFFGTSKGSKDKDESIKNLLQGDK